MRVLLICLLASLHPLAAKAGLTGSYCFSGEEDSSGVDVKVSRTLDFKGASVSSKIQVHADGDGIKCTCKISSSYGITDFSSYSMDWTQETCVSSTCMAQGVDVCAGFVAEICGEEGTRGTHTYSLEPNGDLYLDSKTTYTTRCGSSGLKTWQLVALVVGGVVLVAIIGALLYRCLCKKPAASRDIEHLDDLTAPIHGSSYVRQHDLEDPVHTGQHAPVATSSTLPGVVHHQAA
eukprot:TRINITY_DN326_c0_g1_i1.p1 TRINITY_DN326_c0_g1~~TRINITY_DN326_c0_g1_i1.p1  ORF type:complete len:234 (-),score=25.14 TRINITY_DN326_c0_g1_i1:244-945(-)